MATITPKVNDVVSFQLVQNGLAGDERVDVKVGSEPMNYQTAIRLDQSLNIKHAMLFPYFSDAVNGVDNPSVYSYVVFQGRNGELDVVGVPWIKSSTYRTTSSRPVSTVITNFKEEFRAPLLTFMANMGMTHTGLVDVET